jgi:hypothetical protein
MGGSRVDHRERDSRHRSRISSRITKESEKSLPGTEQRPAPAGAGPTPPLTRHRDRTGNSTGKRSGNSTGTSLRPNPPSPTITTWSGRPRHPPAMSRDARDRPRPPRPRPSRARCGAHHTRPLQRRCAMPTRTASRPARHTATESLQSTSPAEPTTVVQDRHRAPINEALDSYDVPRLRPAFRDTHQSRHRLATTLRGRAATVPASRPGTDPGTRPGTVRAGSCRRVGTRTPTLLRSVGLPPWPPPALGTKSSSPAGWPPGRVTGTQPGTRTGTGLRPGPCPGSATRPGLIPGPISGPGCAMKSLATALTTSDQRPEL